MRFAATIAEVIFAGDIHRYTADGCADGKTVTFKEHRSGGKACASRAGDAITLAFHAEAAVLLPGA